MEQFHYFCCLGLCSKRIVRQRLFFDSLSDHITVNDNSIIGGDFNCYIDNVNTKDASKIILKNVLIEKDLCDVWRTICPEETGLYSLSQSY